MSIIALGWGLVQVLTSGVSLLGTEHQAAVDITQLQALLGYIPLVFGSLGIIGLWTKRLWMRKVACLALSPFWLLLSAYYLLAVPPVWGAVPVYGLDGVFELVIYGRLQYGLTDPR